MTFLESWSTEDFVFLGFIGFGVLVLLVVSFCLGFPVHPIERKTFPWDFNFVTRIPFYRKSEGEKQGLSTRMCNVLERSGVLKCRGC